MALGLWPKPKGSQIATPKDGNQIVHVLKPQIKHEPEHEPNGKEHNQMHTYLYIFKSYLGLVSQVHFSSHGCHCQNESEMLFHISWLGNRREPVCTTPICRKLSKKLERSPFFFFLFFPSGKRIGPRKLKEGKMFHIFWIYRNRF